MNIENKPFPCDACGQCCRRVNLSEQTTFLDRGDGTCKHFDERTHLCQIYDDRPLVCQVEAYYKKHLSNICTWGEFIEINVAVCNELKK